MAAWASCRTVAGARWIILPLIWAPAAISRTWYCTSPSIRASGASSRRSDTSTLPVTPPLITAWGTSMRPMTRPVSLIVSTPSPPASACTEPSTTPSRCNVPLNCTSPRMVRPRAIRLVAAAPTEGVWFFRLLLNMVDLVVSGGVGPGDRSGDRLIAVGTGDDAQAGRLEPGGQGEAPLDLLEILE